MFVHVDLAGVPCVQPIMNLGPSSCSHFQVSTSLLSRHCGTARSRHSPAWLNSCAMITPTYGLFIELCICVPPPAVRPKHHQTRGFGDWRVWKGALARNNSNDIRVHHIDSICGSSSLMCTDTTSVPLLCFSFLMYCSWPNSLFQLFHLQGQSCYERQGHKACSRSHRPEQWCP